MGAVRGKHRIEADVHVRFRSGIACAAAHDTIFEGRRNLIPKYRGFGTATVSSF